MKRAFLVPVYVVAMLAQPVLADDLHTKKAAATAAAPAAAMTEGEVRKVDKAARKITLKHGPIPNINMPPMTMVFHVSDAAMLDRVKAGDKVKFTADEVGGNLTVTRIEARK